MYPAEQAPALKLIYEARAQLVRQNETEIEDLKGRLERATRKQVELVEMMVTAKANYDEAASKIVDLLDDNDNKNVDDDHEGDNHDSNECYDASIGNESKHCPRNLSRSEETRKCDNRDIDYPGGEQARENDKYEMNRGNESKDSSPWKRLRNPYMKKEQITPENRRNNQGGGEDGYDECRGNESKHTPRRIRSIQTNNSCSNEEDAKPAAFQDNRSASIGTKSSLKPIPSKLTVDPTMVEVVDLQESDDEDDHCETVETEDKSSHLSLSPRTQSNAKESNDVAQKQEESSPINKANSSLRGINRASNESTSPSENPTNPKPVNRDDRRTSPVQKRPRSSSTSSNGGAAHKKRAPKSVTSSSAVAFSRRIKLRPRPTDVPPDRWLKSSVGRTPEELNRIDDMVQYMGSCKFGKSVVVSLYGKVYAMVLNDESNTLARRNDEFQVWYVCPGPGRKRDARLVYASQSTIPIFHAPKAEYTTKELFYVGHYKVTNLEELNPPVIEMEKERDVRVTLAFDRFDERLDAIIKRGSDASS